MITYTIEFNLLFWIIVSIFIFAFHLYYLVRLCEILRFYPISKLQVSLLLVSWIMAEDIGLLGHSLQGCSMTNGPGGVVMVL